MHLTKRQVMINSLTSFTLDIELTQIHYRRGRGSSSLFMEDVGKRKGNIV